MPADTPPPMIAAPAAPPTAVPSTTVTPTDGSLLGGQPATLNEALAALKPAIEPPAIPWWPPAPGWWVVAILVVVLASLVCMFAWRRRQRILATRYQREACGLLDHVLEKTGTLAQLQDVARILRRAAISAYGRESAGTQSWADLAQRVTTASPAGKAPAIPVFDEISLGLLTHALYQQQAPAPEQIEHLLAQSRIWLAKLPPHRVHQP